MDNRLTQEVAKSVFRYEDGKLFWRIKPSGRPSRTGFDGEAGGPTGNGYRMICYKGVRLFTHQVVYLMHHGYIPEEIDHIDGDAANNRIDNLREVCHGKNMFNASIRKDNTSGEKGVTWSKRKNAWRARIVAYHKEYSLGFFEKFEDAVSVVRETRIRLHGEFARFA